MRNKVFTILTVVLCTCLMSWSVEAVPQRMTTGAIHGVISNMLEQHIKRHQLDGYSLQKALIHYVEAADPDRIYLQQREVAPYLELSSLQRSELVRQYANEDYSLFRELNAKIQDGIQRSQQLRGYTPLQYTALFQEAERRHAVGAQRTGYEEGWATFSDSAAELQQRHRLHFLAFVQAMMDRFGTEEVMKNQQVVIERYRSQLLYNERAYSYKNADSTSMQTAEMEHLFATNVMKALAVTLDAHSTFFDDAEAFDMKMRLEKGFVGIGVVLQEVLAGYKISEILPDSPASQSPLVKENDLLVAVNDQSLAGLSLEEVMRLVRGVQGERVKLRLTSGNNDIRTVQLMPRLIVIQDGRVEITHEPFHDGIIGTIKLDSFYEGPNGVSSVQDVIDGIRQLSDQGKLHGLILDLRDNSGGYLTQAVKVAGLFITNGVVVMSKYSDGEQHYYRDLDGKAYYDGPLVVLTSRLTASAAEIVAQSLQDYGVALVVGDEQTYGKGTIQAQTITEGDSSQYFKVTVGKYYTVSGVTPQVRGVKADVLLPGEYSSLEVGEGYLEAPLGNDQVHAAFKDNLWDIEPQARAWYAQYYLPTLQAREQEWTAMLPLLRERSGARLDTNKQYQLYLKNHGVDSRWKFGWSEEDVNMKNFDIEDFQVSEAANIVRDMIALEERMAGAAPQDQKADPLFYVGAERRKK